VVLFFFGREKKEKEGVSQRCKRGASFKHEKAEGRRKEVRLVI